MIKRLYRFILRRPFFKGQDRIFSYLFSKNKLYNGIRFCKPTDGKFKINADTGTWIGARIYYTGDYEPYLKRIFKKHILSNDVVLDVGANVGFHSLYFSELVGEGGKVISFEPVPNNFQSLVNNIKLNNFLNIEPHNIALGNKTEKILINADENSDNPGAYNLFNKGGNVSIECDIGDNVLKNTKVNFIKIDVEGYEVFVLDGLKKIIQNEKPKIIFEYTEEYHIKTGCSKDYIFRMLKEMGYSFFHIYQSYEQEIKIFDQLKSGNILALHNHA